MDGELRSRTNVELLCQEAYELASIFGASFRTAKNRQSEILDGMLVRSESQQREATLKQTEAAP